MGISASWGIGIPDRPDRHQETGCRAPRELGCQAEGRTLANYSRTGRNPFGYFTV